MDLFPTLPAVLFHVVFSTREQAPLITPEIRTPLYSHIDGLIRHEDGLVIECGGTADHIHLLTSFSHERSMESMIVQIKSDSAAWINKKLNPDVPFAWQESYLAVTVSQSSAYEDREYIRNQAEIHRHGRARLDMGSRTGYDCSRRQDDEPSHRHAAPQRSRNPLR